MPHMYHTHSPPHTPAHHTHITTPPHYIPHTSYTNTHALHKHPHISHTPHVPPCILVHTAHPLHTSYAHKHTCPYTTPAHHAQIHTYYTHHPRTPRTRIYTHARTREMLCYLVLGARPRMLPDVLPPSAVIFVSRVFIPGPLAGGPISTCQDQPHGRAPCQA